MRIHDRLLSYMHNQLIHSALYLIPCPGPHAMFSIHKFWVPEPIEMQSSPVWILEFMMVTPLDCSTWMPSVLGLLLDAVIFSPSTFTSVHVSMTMWKSSLSTEVSPANVISLELLNTSDCNLMRNRWFHITDISSKTYLTVYIVWTVRSKHIRGDVYITYSCSIRTASFASLTSPQGRALAIYVPSLESQSFNVIELDDVAGGTIQIIVGRRDQVAVDLHCNLAVLTWAGEEGRVQQELAGRHIQGGGLWCRTCSRPCFSESSTIVCYSICFGTIALNVEDCSPHHMEKGATYQEKRKKETVVCHGRMLVRRKDGDGVESMIGRCFLRPFIELQAPYRLPFEPRCCSTRLVTDGAMFHNNLSFEMRKIGIMFHNGLSTVFLSAQSFCFCYFMRSIWHERSPESSFFIIFRLNWPKFRLTRDEMRPNLMAIKVFTCGFDWLWDCIIS